MAYFDVDRSSEFGFGAPRPVSGLRGVCIHTTEGVSSANATPQTADNVTSYQARSRTGSYNVMVGVDGKRIRQNTDNWRVWATGNQGNDILLHLCFVGKASQSRGEWLAQDRMLRAGASVVRHWCDKYGFPVRKVDVWHLPGILGHADTRAWGGTNHTDPGPNFPYDVFLDMVRGGGKPAPNLIDQAADRCPWVGDRLSKDEIPTPGHGGAFVPYSNAHIYWRDGAKAAYPIPHGGLFESFADHGFEQGVLGFPIRDFTRLDDGGVQAFQGGILYRKNSSDAGYVVHGAIGDQYARLGFEESFLGWPVSDEIESGGFGAGAIVQRFEGGKLVWAPSGVITIKEKA